MSSAGIYFKIEILKINISYVWQIIIFSAKICITEGVSMGWVNEVPEMRESHRFVLDMKQSQNAFHRDLWYLNPQERTNSQRNKPLSMSHVNDYVLNTIFKGRNRRTIQNVSSLLKNTKECLPL